MYDTQSLYTSLFLQRYFIVDSYMIRYEILLLPFQSTVFSGGPVINYGNFTTSVYSMGDTSDTY